MGKHVLLRERRLCCSQKIVLASYVTTALLTLVTVLGTFFTSRDMTALATVTALSWAETAASNAAYFWKAKTENRIKLSDKMVEDLADKYGIDAVVNLAGVVIKD